MTEISARSRRFDSARHAIVGTAILPVAAVASSPIHAGLAHWLLAAGIVGLGLAVGLAMRPASGLACWFAVLGLGASGSMFLFASYPGAVHVLAAPYGLALGLLATRPVRWVQYLQVAAGAALVGAAYLLNPALAAGLAVAAAIVAAAAPSGEQQRSVRRPLAAGIAAALAGLLSILWVGSTAPAVTWFGALTSHGPRASSMVALTFDDGPNGEYTLETARILDEHGAKGTFFEVGKAVRAEPGVSRTLIAGGHLVGNHSFRHDATSYLDPRYPELARAETEIAAATGLCPALFRPPHGTHTPFMSHVAEDSGMRLVTWDVSGRDWVENDADALARRILSKVKPGSIILLHDGLDGKPGADRSVILRALPAILDGLRKRGLEAVTLDRLLNVAPYLSGPSCGRFRVSSGFADTLPSDGLSQEESRAGSAYPPRRHVRRALSPDAPPWDERRLFSHPLRGVGVLPSLLA